MLYISGHSMCMEQDDIANECWNFELWLYEQPGVSRCCLSLQDRYGVDVVLLLLCAWLGTKDCVLSEAEISEAATQIAPWRTTIVESLRRTRRNFQSLSYPDDPTLSRLYKQLKLSELTAERIEISLLSNQSNSLLSSFRRGAKKTNTIEKNILAYLTGLMTEHDREKMTEEVAPIIFACAHYKTSIQSGVAAKSSDEHSARTRHGDDDLMTRIGIFLDQNYIMSLATLGPSGIHAANLLYARDNLSLIWVSEPETRHSQNLESYRHVAATVAATTVDFDAIQGIQIHGAAQRKRLDNDGSRLLGLLKDRYPALKERSDSSEAAHRALQHAEVYLLEPSSITFIDNTKKFGYKKTIEFS